MDYIVSRAISEGVNPITAIQMATINTAQCFKLDGEIGAIAPGRFADINILSDLSKVKIEKVIINGKDVAECGCLLNKTDDYIYPEQFRASVKISRQIKASDFSVKAPDGAQTVDVKTIEVHEASSLTTKTIRRLPVEGGLIDSIPAMDILKVAVIDRHHENGSMSVGFVKGFNLKKGAVASTYAHDAHNLLVVGVNEEDMAFAANKLIECGGGMIAVEDGKVLTLLELPIAGLISDEPAIDVAKALRGLEAAWLELGSPIVSPFMTMSLLSLAVIPEIRITNRGIVDVTHMKLTSLID
jgi:adenine deaminase